MTLAEWQAEYGPMAGVHHTGARWIPVSLVSSARGLAWWDLYHLADYRVTANSGGSYWLTPI